MSEKSKKKPRKSKLVACTYVDLENEVTEESEVKSELSNFESNLTPTPSNIGFDVKVEVEEGDEEWFKEMQRQERSMRPLPEVEKPIVTKSDKHDTETVTKLKRRKYTLKVVDDGTLPDTRPKPGIITRKKSQIDLPVDDPKVNEEITILETEYAIPKVADEPAEIIVTSELQQSRNKSEKNDPPANDPKLNEENHSIPKAENTIPKIADESADITVTLELQHRKRKKSEEIVLLVDDSKVNEVTRSIPEPENAIPQTDDSAEIIVTSNLPGPSSINTKPKIKVLNKELLSETSKTTDDEDLNNPFSLHENVIFAVDLTSPREHFKEHTLTSLAIKLSPYCSLDGKNKFCFSAFSCHLCGTEIQNTKQCINLFQAHLKNKHLHTGYFVTVTKSILDNNNMLVATRDPTQYDNHNVIVGDVGLKHYVFVHREYIDAINFLLMQMHMDAAAGNDQNPILMGYKCYACGNLYEELNNFLIHLNNIHTSKQLYMAIENPAQNFINVVASKKPYPEFADFAVNPSLNQYKCLKCKKTFRSLDSYVEHSTKSAFSCSGCSTCLPCYALRKHKGYCQKYLNNFYPKICPCKMVFHRARDMDIHQSIECAFGKTVLAFYCSICLFTAPTEKSIEFHNKNEHHVRSDQFMMSRTWLCRLCSEPHVGSLDLHECVERVDTHMCRFCGSSFQNNLFWKIHNGIYEKATICVKCDPPCVLPAQCMSLEHDITFHDSEYVIKYQCNVCFKLFDVQNNVGHIAEAHRKSNWSLLPYRYKKLILKKVKVQEADVVTNNCVIKIEWRDALTNRPLKRKAIEPEIIEGTSNHSSKVNEGASTSKLIKVLDQFGEIPDYNSDEDEGTKELKDAKHIENNGIKTYSRAIKASNECPKNNDNLEDYTGAEENSGETDEQPDVLNVIKTEQEIFYDKFDETRTESPQDLNNEVILQRKDEELKSTIKSELDARTEVIIKTEVTTDNYTEYDSNVPKEATNFTVVKAEAMDEDVNFNIEMQVDLPETETRHSELLKLLDIETEITPNYIRPTKRIRYEDDVGEGCSKDFVAVQVKTEIDEPPSPKSPKRTKIVLTYGNIAEEQKVVKKEMKVKDIVILKERKTKVYTCKNCGFSAYNNKYFAHKKTCRKKQGRRPKTGDGKPKVYACANCSFTGYCNSYLKHKMTCKKYIKKKRKMPKTEEEEKDEKEKETTTTELKYTCTKCAMTCDDLRIYLKHLLKHGYLKDECPVCAERLNSIDELTMHAMRHIKEDFKKVQVLDKKTNTQEKRFRCNHCKLIVKKDEFFQHWQTHFDRNGRKPLSIRVATMLGEKELPEKDVLPQRMVADVTDLLQMSVKEMPRVCIVCQHRFSRGPETKRHYIEHLMRDAIGTREHGDFTLKCQICGEVTLKDHLYKRHMREHAELPLYQCQICDRTFSDSSNFAKHKKVHNLRVLICDLCSRKFQCKKTLARHMKEHESNQSWECEECDKTYYFESTYKKHLKSKHDAYKANCFICKQKFLTMKEKWDHEWTEHGFRKKIVWCPVCDTKFRKFIDAKNHIREDHSVQATLSTSKLNSVCKLVKTFGLSSLDALAMLKTGNDEIESEVLMRAVQNRCT